jgi:hypothetical protein
VKYRVSNVEAFRKWEADPDAEPEDLDRLLADIRGESAPSQAMAAGTAFHACLEHAVAGIDFDSLSHGGFVFTFADQFDIEVTPIRELRASKTYMVDGQPIFISGQVDAIDGLRIEDHKTTGRFDPDRYLTGYQWRLYLDIFGARHFRWNVFEMKEVESTQESFGFEAPPSSTKSSPSTGSSSSATRRSRPTARRSSSASRVSCASTPRSARRPEVDVVLIRTEEGLKGLGEKSGKHYETFRNHVKSMPVGETVRFTWKKPRSPKFHALFFAVLGNVFDAQEQFSTADQLRTWLPSARATRPRARPTGKHGRDAEVDRVGDDGRPRVHELVEAVWQFLRTPHAPVSLAGDAARPLSAEAVDRLLVSYD